MVQDFGGAFLGSIGKLVDEFSEICETFFGWTADPCFWPAVECFAEWNSVTSCVLVEFGDAAVTDAAFRDVEDSFE